MLDQSRDAECIDAGLPELVTHLGMGCGFVNHSKYISFDSLLWLLFKKISRE